MMLENELRGFAAFFGALMMAIGNTFPAVSARRAISSTMTIVVIIVIIVAGAAIVVGIFVINPGGVSTSTITSTYP